ncbi:hypothetical protein [Streptomyces sp. H39-S7]|uniref:hypothetical protein n=1 Tax=Streptomyces sp. H39-S7 TaxID=3004357 RepID=UPI0022B06D7C|nr:hypothetical protein [Streptomyces sp. H39-S7]MCZ4118544.1 hypothetical protein [Streptomyces sp. H39-S7]
MFRNIFGSLIALLGAAAAVWSPFRAWYGGRHGSEIRMEDLFDGITADRAAVMGSLFLPMLFAALITLLGILLRSRLLVGCAGILVLGFTILWMVRQGLSAGSLTAGGDGLGIGVVNALGGGVLLLIGAATMSGRRHRSAYGRRPPHTAEPAAYAEPVSHHPEPVEPAAYAEPPGSPAPADRANDLPTWPQPETAPRPAAPPSEPTVYDQPTLTDNHPPRPPDQQT